MTTFSPSKRRSLLKAGGVAMVACASPWVLAQKPFRYLFPAPAFLPSFTPFSVARFKGYYKEAGLNVEFGQAAGGLDVARKLVSGEADMGGATGDTPLLLRAQGLPVKATTVLGGHSLTQIVVRRDRNIYLPEDFRGKTFSVTSLTDTTYYTLLGFLASIGQPVENVKILAGGPVGVFKNLIEGKADAMAGVPDWVVQVQQTDLKTMLFNSDSFFPSMAQAVLASDQAIAGNGGALKAFIGATLRGLADTMADPAGAAGQVVQNFKEQHKAAPQLVAKTVQYFVERVYVGQSRLGEVSATRMQKVQAFYLRQKLIDRALPVTDHFTNQFLEG